LATTLSGLGSIAVGAVTADDMEVELSGSGTITFDQVQAGHLATTLSGLGSIIVGTVTAESTAVSVPGRGSIVMAGTSTQLDVDIEGEGYFYGPQGPDLSVESALVTIGGFGSVSVNVSGTLVVTIDGEGYVYYAGDPQVTSTIEGEGSVTQV
jgi:hypothetical protein